MASLCHPPVACRSPDHLIKSCQRRKWSHGVVTGGTESRKRNKRPDAKKKKEIKMDAGENMQKINKLKRQWRFLDESKITKK